MTRVFISQPMRDKTNEEIKKERRAAIEYVKKELGDDVEVIDSFFEGAPHDAKPLWFLGKSFQLLSTADAAVFIGDWYKYRGCKMEHEAATQYGIETMCYNGKPKAETDGFITAGV
jgi:hypothetical protein